MGVLSTGFILLEVPTVMTNNYDDTVLYDTGTVAHARYQSRVPGTLYNKVHLSRVDQTESNNFEQRTQ